MISGKNILLNVAPQINSANTSKASSSEDVIALMLNGTEEKKDSSTDENAVDPSSFVLLLSQLFSNNLPQNPANDANAVATMTPEDIQNSLLSQLTNSGATNQQANSADMTAIQTDPNNQDALAVQTDNPALDWLESQNFQALQATGKNNSLPTDAANKAPIPTTKAQTETNTVLKNTLMNAQNQPAAVDSSADSSKVTAQVNENPVISLQQLSTSISNLDKAPIALVGGKSDTASQDLIDAANNTAMGHANQPGQIQLAAQPKALDIPVPLHHPEWGDKFADHVVWLGQNDIKSAVIKIHPEELGPLEISVKVVKDSASVNIISHSAQARDIVDQAIPRLRDMMAAQGLTLSDVQVNVDQRSGNSFAQNNNNEPQQQEASGFSDADDEVQFVTSVKKPPKGLVDYFA